METRAAIPPSALDDFGTGYSSLSYLSRLPLDHLKIDRVFVDRIDRRPENAAIVGAVIEVAHGMGLRVIAEGVETESERALLAARGADEIQGYLFSKPLPEPELRRWLDRFR